MPVIARSAERSESGSKWGVYQIDVKFYPDRDYVEMWVEFESYLPGSIPSYKDCFKMDWDEGKQYVQKRGGGWHGDVAGACMGWCGAASRVCLI